VPVVAVALMLGIFGVLTRDFDYQKEGGARSPISAYYHFGFASETCFMGSASRCAFSFNLTGSTSEPPMTIVVDDFDVAVEKNGSSLGPWLPPAALTGPSGCELALWNFSSSSGMTPATSACAVAGNQAPVGTSASLLIWDASASTVHAVGGAHLSLTCVTAPFAGPLSAIMP
jgi:hypothetical protein